MSHSSVIGTDVREAANGIDAMGGSASPESRPPRHPSAAVPRPPPSKRLEEDGRAAPHPQSRGRQMDAGGGHMNCAPSGHRAGPPGEGPIPDSRQRGSRPPWDAVEQDSSGEDERSLERGEAEERRRRRRKKKKKNSQTLSTASTPTEQEAEKGGRRGPCGQSRGACQAAGGPRDEDEGSTSPTQKNRPNPFNHLPLQASSLPACPPHVMAQVHVRNAPVGGAGLPRLQDSKSLDRISQVCGGPRGRDRQPEGRRATISSALELEGTVSHDGDLTHFVAKDLQQKIKMSSCQSLDSDSSVRSRGSQRKPADIPPIDPAVLLDLQKHTQDVAHSVELMTRSLNGTIQNMTALSVGYIQTYRDSVDSLGESVDMSIKGMYTLMARCEELDRSMQPIHSLAKQIRDIKRTLDSLESLCK
ncbi:BLOC-1-related complex subunit 6 [Amia ocellicauda]|uniref:BLOC-1-related complex subunit 6 n=1 Tax=Amia ocellicauda TaxID=2972642 RepID=UPI00346388A5